MDESSLRALWQEQPLDPAAPSELALTRTPARVDFAQPTSTFHHQPTPRRSFVALTALAAAIALGVVGWKVQPLQPEANERVERLEAPHPSPRETLAIDPGALSNRFDEPELNAAVAAYFKGDFEAALMGTEKAARHPKAKALRLDMENAIRLSLDANAELTLRDNLERAAALYRQALELDERIVLGEASAALSPVERRRALSTRESFLRGRALRAMASQAFDKGGRLADRKDFRAACRTWKLGLEFNRANIDLLKAVTNVCTRLARDALDRAQSCEQLRVTLDFAVEGDGVREAVEEALESRSCP